jgi:hypothetical protein
MLKSIFQFLKELYLAEFTSFYKASSGSWTPGINAAKGATGVALFEWIILAGIASWLDILAGTRFLLQFSKLAIVIAFFALYFVNYYVLVTRGHGIKFEREFNNLKKSKRTLLRISCYLMELATVAFFICSVYAYHHFFHIIPKSGF